MNTVRGGDFITQIGAKEASRHLGVTPWRTGAQIWLHQLNKIPTIAMPQSFIKLLPYPN